MPTTTEPAALLPESLKALVEVLLFSSETPLSLTELRNLFAEDQRPATAELRAAIGELQQDCAGRGLELVEIGTGFRYQTRVEYAPWLARLHAERPPKLSKALLETLSVIAYRQPVTRADIEQVRGIAVSADIMQRLQDWGWIRQVGVRETPGRPALFATTPAFLSHFGLADLESLPPLIVPTTAPVGEEPFDPSDLSDQPDPSDPAEFSDPSDPEGTADPLDVD